MVAPLKANSIKKIINYCFLLAYCPPEQLSEFREGSLPLRQQAAAANQLPEEDFFPRAVLAACERIVSFHQGTATPEESLVRELAEAVQQADSSPAALSEYQQLMQNVAELPGRADLKTRLHRKRGCALCTAPCAYGFFSLISKPNFNVLLQVLQNEKQKAGAQQRPLLILWAFTRHHLRSTLGGEMDFITTSHLGNLAFCLYVLSTVKSRYPFQEQAVHRLQEANQEMIRTRSASSLVQSQG